jgi:PncC family amidohydrolase
MLIKQGGEFMNFHEDNKSVTESIDRLAFDVVKYMKEQGLTLSTAESCTGGLLSAAITSVPGASAVFEGGAVVYTESLKVKLLGVSQHTLDTYTVYSEETAVEMSRGVRKLTGSDFGIGITGIAGPDGGTDEKPVGTVYVSISGKDTADVVRNLKLYEKSEYGKLDRGKIRRLTVLGTLELMSAILKGNDPERI